MSQVNSPPVNPPRVLNLTKSIAQKICIVGECIVIFKENEHDDIIIYYSLMYTLKNITLNREDYTNRFASNDPIGIIIYNILEEQPKSDRNIKQDLRRKPDLYMNLKLATPKLILKITKKPAEYWEHMGGRYHGRRTRRKRRDIHKQRSSHKRHTYHKRK